MFKGINEFRKFLQDEGKSENTVDSYVGHAKEFIKWYEELYAGRFNVLYRANVLEFKAYLQITKRNNAKSINAKLAGIIKFNEFLVVTKKQKTKVVNDKDYIKIQVDVANPTNVTKKEVESFRQEILEKSNVRDYALVTLLMFTGLRISEALNIRLESIELTAKEVLIVGKGGKQRLVYLNDKTVLAIKEYLKVRKSESEYLFVSRENGKVSRSRINDIFNKHSDKITPHTLRHFFCTHALENGYSIHEVANQAGHSNIHTTLIYTNPSRDKMKEKANLL